jgi:hypothetical protein
MTSQEIGDYLKSNAKSSGGFIPIYIQSAYHTIDGLTHFFFQKKHEWFAVCFLDRFFQCHAIWLEKGKDYSSVSPKLSVSLAIKFANLNNFKHIVSSHNHIVTSGDISYYRSHGTNIFLLENRRQLYLKYSKADKEYSDSFVKECDKEGLNSVFSVIVGGEIYLEGHQSILDNIEQNKPKIRTFIPIKSLEINVDKSKFKKLVGLEEIVPRKVQLKFLPYQKEVEDLLSLKEYKGLLGFYKLNDWWDKNFSAEEQQYIASRYNKYYYQNNSDNSHLCRLREAKIIYPPGSQMEFITSILVGFDGKNRDISLKIYEKAEDLITPITPVLDVHFFYMTQIRIFYSLRNLDNIFF